MKKILFLIIFCLIFTNNFSEGDITMPTLEDCDYISIFHGPWIFKFSEDGAISAQYGSGPFDNGHIPEGSIDFKLFYYEVKKLLIQKKVNCSTQAIFHKRGEKSSTAIYLIENLYLKEFLEKFDYNWTSVSIENFKKLKNKYPFFND